MAKRNPVALIPLKPPIDLILSWVLTWALAVGGMLILVSLWCVLGRPIEAKFRSATFDATRWRVQALCAEFRKDPWPPRLLMVDDLLASGALVGLSSAEVFERLGPPDRQHMSDDQTSQAVSYDLGPARRAFPLDWENLSVSFTATGEVERAWVW